MSDEKSQSIKSNGAEKDPYDEFDERIRRIGDVILRAFLSFRDGWQALDFNQRLGHVAAIATLGAIIFYTGYTVQIYGASKKSADTARYALVEGQRAWIGIEGHLTNWGEPPTFGPPYTKVNGSVTLKNFGPSPAFNVETQATISGTESGVDSAANTSCVAAEEWFGFKTKDIQRIAHNQSAWITIFPGQTKPVSFSGGGAPGDGNNIYVLGCIFYRDEFGNKRRTRFCEMETLTLDKKWSTRACDIYNDAD